MDPLIIAGNVIVLMILNILNVRSLSDNFEFWGPETQNLKFESTCFKFLKFGVYRKMDTHRIIYDVEYKNKNCILNIYPLTNTPLTYPVLYITEKQFNEYVKGLEILHPVEFSGICRAVRFKTEESSKTLDLGYVVLQKFENLQEFIDKSLLTAFTTDEMNRRVFKSYYISKLESYLKYIDDEVKKLIENACLASFTIFDLNFALQDIRLYNNKVFMDCDFLTKEKCEGVEKYKDVFYRKAIEYINSIVDDFNQIIMIP